MSPKQKKKKTHIKNVFNLIVLCNYNSFPYKFSEFASAFSTTITSAIKGGYKLYQKRNKKYYFYLGISADIANFGHIPYGQTLIGNILLTTPRNACSPIVPLQGDYNEPAPVVMVDRGQCSFVTKSFYSQLIGSKLCVIVDDRVENIHEIMMIDDGFGRSYISIYFF